MSHLKNKRSSSTGFYQLERAWGGSGNQWMFCFDIYPTVHMPSARISGWLVTPRSPSLAGSLRISEPQESFESNMATQSGYPEQATNRFCIFQEHKVYCTCIIILLHTHGKSGIPWSYQTYLLRASVTHTALQDTSYFTPSENTSVLCCSSGCPERLFKLSCKWKLPSQPLQDTTKGKGKLKQAT